MTLDDLAQDPTWAEKVRSARADGHSWEDIQAYLTERGVIEPPKGYARFEDQTTGTTRWVLPDEAKRLAKVAKPMPADAPQALTGTSGVTTSEPTVTPTSGFAYGVAQRAGLRPQDLQPSPDPTAEALNAQAFGGAGRVLNTLNRASDVGQRAVTGAFGLPFAVAGQAAQAVTGSRTAGDVAQYAPQALPVAGLAARRMFARPLANRALRQLDQQIAERVQQIAEAKTQVPVLEQQAVANAPQTLQTSPAVVGKATQAALTEARDRAASMASRAVQAAREADPTGIVPEPQVAQPAVSRPTGLVDPRGRPISRVVTPAQPERTVTMADVPADLPNERRIARQLSNEAERFQRYVLQAEDAPPAKAVEILMQGAQVGGPGKVGLKLPAAEAAQLEVRVQKLVTKAMDAVTPAQGIRMLEKAAALRKVEIPELTQARAMLTRIEQLGTQNAEAQARAQQLRDYLRQPSFTTRVARFLLPASIYAAGRMAAESVSRSRP